MPTRARSKSSGLMSERISPAAIARSSKAPTAFVRRSNVNAARFRRALNGERQCGGHALLGGDELDIGSQPAAQGIDGRGSHLQLFRQFDELLHLAAIDCLEQILTRREVAVERPDADAGPSGHGLQARVRTARAEHGLCRLQHALAIANRIGAWLPNGSVAWSAILLS